MARAVCFGRPCCYCENLRNGIEQISTLSADQQHSTVSKQGSGMPASRELHCASQRETTRRRIVDLGRLQRQAALIASCDQHPAVGQQG